MPRHLRLLAALVAAFALAAAGLVTTSAQAATTPTVSGRVVDADGVGVRGLTVVAYNGDEDFAYVGTTRNGGLFSSSTDSELTTGSWTLVVTDDDENPEYALTSKPVTVVAGANALGDVVVPLASKAEGSVTAPSGRKLSNVTVLSLPGDGSFPEEEPDDPLFFEKIGFAVSDTAGSFRIPGLSVGQHTAFAVFEEDENLPSQHATFTVATPGETVTGVNLTDIKVFPSVRLRGSSPAKGKAKLVLTVSAARYGIANAGGRFDLYLGAKKIRSAVGFTNGSRTVNLIGLGKGKRTFRFKYLGSTDTRPMWSKRITVTIL
jgi:hypothetical protein